MTLRIELLPAGYGDAILVGWGAGEQPAHYLLIDAGQATTVGALEERLKQLRDDGGAIDLFVITHIDNDHIGGALKLLGNDDIVPMIRTVWFNGYVHLDQAAGLLGPIQGEQLTAKIVEQKINWNQGWPNSIKRRVGGPVVAPTPVTRKLAGGARVIVLSPTPGKLAALLPEWDRVVAAAGLRPGQAAQEEPEVLAPGLLGGNLEDLAAARTNNDTAPANGSSIAFVFEYDGRRVLFGADAHPEVLTAAIKQLGASPYPVDACKLPHHGSKSNVTAALVQSLNCPCWLISSNGVRFRHPDDSALARVLVHGRRNGHPPQLGWNYKSDRFKAFTSDYPSTNKKFPYSLLHTTSDGLVLEL